MQKSMTGFGKAEVVVNGKTFTAEIRSLNSKQLDLGVKTPAAYRELENDIRSLVSKRVVRGKVDLNISVVSTEVATASRIDKALLATYIKQIDEALAYAGVSVDYEAIIPSAMKMPNVVQNDATEASDDEKEAIMKAVEGAIDRLDAFRKQEHEVICRVGAEHGQIIATGGGAVTRQENQYPLEQNGRIVWLQRPPEMLPTEGRPLSHKDTLAEMYRARASLYRCFSDMQIPNDGTPDEVAARIAKELHYEILSD